MKTIDRLNSWLKKPGNTKALIASLLGYETSNAVTQWVKRNAIPKREELRVLDIINLNPKKER